MFNTIMMSAARPMEELRAPYTVSIEKTNPETNIKVASRNTEWKLR
jgi:hypothetical protein